MSTLILILNILLICLNKEVNKCDNNYYKIILKKNSIYKKFKLKLNLNKFNIFTLKKDYNGINYSIPNLGNVIIDNKIYIFKNLYINTSGHYIINKIKSKAEIILNFENEKSFIGIIFNIKNNKKNDFTNMGINNNLLNQYYKSKSFKIYKLNNLSSLQNHTKFYMFNDLNINCIKKQYFISKKTINLSNKQIKIINKLNLNIIKKDAKKKIIKNIYRNFDINKNSIKINQKNLSNLNNKKEKHYINKNKILQKNNEEEKKNSKPKINNKIEEKKNNNVKSKNSINNVKTKKNNNNSESKNNNNNNKHFKSIKYNLKPEILPLKIIFPNKKLSKKVNVKNLKIPKCKSKNYQNIILFYYPKDINESINKTNNIYIPYYIKIPNIFVFKSYINKNIPIVSKPNKEIIIIKIIKKHNFYKIKFIKNYPKLIDYIQSNKTLPSSFLKGIKSTINRVTNINLYKSKYYNIKCDKLYDMLNNNQNELNMTSKYEIKKIINDKCTNKISSKISSFSNTIGKTVNNLVGNK